MTVLLIRVLSLMRVLPYIYKKTVSSILIVTIMLSQVIIIDPVVQAADATKDTMNLVALLVAEELLKDDVSSEGLTKDVSAGSMNADISRIMADGSLRSDLETLGVKNISDSVPRTIGGRILRYADDIQKQLQNTKIIIIPVPSMDNPEKPWRIQEVLDRLYTEGDITDDKIAKLQGLVMIGDVPLPLVNKGGRSFLSVYPYTDFEDPAYYFDHQKGQFIFNEESGTLKAEVWHGVIRYPVSWQQFYLDGPQVNAQGFKAFAASISQKTTGEQIAALKTYATTNLQGLDQNNYNTFLSGIGQKSAEEQKTGLTQYITDHAAAEDDKVYEETLRDDTKKGETREKMKEKFMELQRKELATYFDKNHSYYIGGEYSKFSKKAIQMDLFRELGQVTQLSLQGYQEFIENWDNISYMRYTKKWLAALTEKYYPKTKAQFENIASVPTDNPNVGASDPTKKDVFATVKDLAGKFEDSGTSAQNLMPDIFTKDPIDKLLSRATDVFGFLTNSYVGYFNGTGRWDFSGKIEKADATSLFKIIATLDQDSQKHIREVNDSMEKVLDEMLDKYQNDKNLVLDMPSGEVNYFGKFLQALRMTRPHPYIDVDPSPEWSNNYGGKLGTNNIFFTPLQIDVKEKNAKDTARDRYIPFTGQEFDQVIVHVEADPRAQYKMLGYNGYEGGSVKGNTGSGTPTGQPYLYYNPNATQEKYIEYVDDVKPADPFTGFKVFWEQVTKGKVSGETLTNATPRPYRKAVLHLVNKPFSAEDCTIFVGGAPEGGLFVRGEDAVGDPKVEGWTDPTYKGKPGGSGWRDEKVEAQVAFDIALLDADIKTRDANRPTPGENEKCLTSLDSYNKETDNLRVDMYVKILDLTISWIKYYNVSVIPTDIAKDIVNQRIAIATERLNIEERYGCGKVDKSEEKDALLLPSAVDPQIVSEKLLWEQYMSSGERGDEGRMKNFIEYAKRLPQTTAQTVEANKLYNIAADAYMEYTKDDKSEQEKRPETEFYNNLDPDGTGGFGWGINADDPEHGNDDSGWKSGYFGDCVAPNLEFTDAGDAVPPDSSAAKGRLSAEIAKVRAQKSDIIKNVGGFFKGILTLGQADKLEKGGIQQGVLLRMKLAPETARWESGSSEIDRVVAILRKIENPEEKVKTFEDPLDFGIAAAVLNSIQDPTYNPNPKSSDPLDKLVAAYRTLPNTAEQSKYNMLFSIIQMAIGQSKYDPDDENNKKHECQPMKALLPIKDTAGSKSVTSPSYKPLTATRVIERENATLPVPFNFIMGPDAPKGNDTPAPQLTVTAETKTGRIVTEPAGKDLAAEMNQKDKAKVEAWAQFNKDYLSLLKGSVKNFFHGSPFKPGPGIAIESKTTNGTDMRPYREQITAQNRYAIPVKPPEAIKPETSYQACLLYADYGIPLNGYQKKAREAVINDINKLQSVEGAYIKKHYGAKEQLPPVLQPSERTWLEYELGDSPKTITHFFATMFQKQNGEEKLGLDKKQSVVSIIKHKEPTNETISKQLKNSVSFDLPVDSPRYVDMFHYDPIPKWGVVSTIDKDGKTKFKDRILSWTEYYEHMRFPYLDWFNVFAKDKRFAYVTVDSRASFKKTISDITTETRGIAQHFQQYINDYLAQTSLTGGAAKGRDTLKGMSFDYNKSLKESAIIADLKDDPKKSAAENDARKVQVAEQRLAFAVYWQHLPLSEKYKYVLHNYLSSDVTLSQGDTPVVDPVYFGDKTGFEAGTIIAESSFPDSIPLGLENLTYTKEQKPSVVLPAPVNVNIEEKVTTCKNENFYNPTGVPLKDWPKAIADCWFPTLTPPITFPNDNEKFDTFAKRISEAGQEVVSTGKNIKDDFVKFGTSVKQFAETAGKVGEALGNTFQDIDGDGLPMVGSPSDQNVFLSDTKMRVNGILVEGSNGFKDVQDYTEKLTLKVDGKDNVKRTILSTKSLEALKIQAELRTKDGQLLPGNSFDYVEIEFDENASKIAAISNSEKMQRADKGVVNFNLLPVFGMTGIEGKVRFHLMRQKVSNSDQPFERLNPDIASDWVTLKSTDDSLSVAYLNSPEASNGRASYSEAAIFTTDDKIHTLSMAAVDSKGSTLKQKNGNLTIEYRKENEENGEFEPYKETKITSRIVAGINALHLPIPSEAGKYLVEIIPEAALELPPVKTTFIVIESKIAAVNMKLVPNVLIEGGTAFAELSFLDTAKKEIPMSDQLGQFVVPTNPQIPLTIQSEQQIDGYPENKTASENPIDFVVGKVNQLTLTTGELPEGAPDYVDIPLRLQVSDTIRKSSDLRVYKKGSLEIKTVVVNDKPSYSVMDDTSIRIDVSITDKAGAIVPYNGKLTVDYSDKGYVADPISEIEVKDGRAVLSLRNAHKSGVLNLTIKDKEQSFTPKGLSFKFTPGPLSKVHFTSYVDRPMEPVTEDSKLGKNMTEMMIDYQGEDMYGNVIETNDPVLFELTPFEGLELFGAKADGSDGGKLPVISVGTKKYYGQTLTAGKGRVKFKSTKFTGEVTIVLAGQASDKITRDSIRIPVRFTLYKEFIQRLKPNILYTNLLGGNYGDVTKKDFMAGWWLLSGKTQAVTASTISSHSDPVSVRVLPNGTIDIPQGNGVSSKKAVIPLFNQGEPFQLEVREQDTNKTLMRVRYNIKPLSVVKEITSESQIGTTPGIYFRKSGDTKVTRDEGKKMSVINYAGKEIGVLGDNLQFLPTGLPPEIEVNTDRNDLLEMSMKSPEGIDILDMFVVLEPENIYETSQGFASDKDIAKTKKESVNYEAQASAGKTNIQFSDSLKKATEILTSKKILTPVPDKDRYVNKVIVNRSDLDQYKGGTFMEASSASLYSMSGGNVVLAGVDTLLNPDNVQGSVSTMNRLASQKSQPVIKVQASSGGILSSYQLQDVNRGNKTRELFQMQQIFRGKAPEVAPLDSNIRPGLFADMKLADTLKVSEKIDTSLTGDKIRLEKTFITTIPASQNGNVNIPARTETEKVLAAEVYSDGSYLLGDARFEMKRTFAANVIKYTLVEKSKGKTLSNIVMILNPSLLRVLPYSEGTTLLYSSKEQGVYVEMKDPASSFDEVTREIRKGSERVLSFLPEHFMEVAQGTYNLTVKDPLANNLNTRNPLVLQFRNTSNVLIADLYVQLGEAGFDFITTTTDAEPAEDLKGIVSTELPVENADGEIRIKNTDGKTLWSFEKNTFENRVMPAGNWNISPEQLENGIYNFYLKENTTVKAKVSFKLSKRFVTPKENIGIANTRMPAAHLRKVDPYTVWTRNPAGAIEGFSLKEFNTAFSLEKPQDFPSKILEITSKNIYSASFGYQDERAAVSVNITNKDNAAQKKTLIEMKGSYAPEDIPMKLYEGENTTGIYFTDAKVKNASLLNGYTLERRVEGEDRTYWRIKKDEAGKITDEKNIAKIFRDGSVMLGDDGYVWKNSYAAGNYVMSLHEKSTGTLLDTVSILLKQGTVTRVLPYKNGPATLYSPGYQGVYTDILDGEYMLDQNSFGIRRKNVTLDEILSFKKDTFFTLNGGQNLVLEPQTLELSQTGRSFAPTISLVDKTLSKRVANIYLSLAESAPRISVKQNPAQNERTAQQQNTALLSIMQNSISVNDANDELQVIQTTGDLQNVLWAISKKDVSRGRVKTDLADVKVSAFSQDGMYLTLLPKGETDEAKAFAVLSYKNDSKYTPLKFIGKNSFGEIVNRPGMYIREADSLVSLKADPVLFTQSIWYGYDEAAVMSANGVLQSKNPNIFTIALPDVQPVPNTALMLGINAFGTDIARIFYKFSDLSFSSINVPASLALKGIDEVLPSSGNAVTILDYKEWGTEKGVEIISDTLGHIISAAFENTPVATWTQAFVPILLEKTKLVYDPSVAKGAVFTLLKENGERLMSYVITPNFVEKTTLDTNPPEVTEEGTDSISDPVKAAASAADKTFNDTQEALSLLDGHGLFVEKRVTDNWFSLGYEASGESTNNPYAIVLKDQTLSTSKTDTAGGTGIGVEDALTDSGSGAGWTGDFKNMVLFAAGNNVGKSTLPHMSEALINIGDPVISLKIEPTDNRTNDMFTNDVGEFIMEHARAGINTLKVFDIDNDGRKDILFAEKTGKIYGIKNMGGNPVMWKYMGEMFDVPDGINKLLITKLDDDDKLDLMISTGKDNIIAGRNEGIKAMSHVQGSIVSLKNLGEGMYQRSVNAIKDLGKVEDMQMGDFDGNGIDDLFAVTDKKELKVVLIAPILGDGTKPPFKVVTLDTLGVSMTNRELAAEDVYVRFQHTPLFDQNDAPKAMPTSPDVVFVPNMQGQGAINAEALSKDDPGREGFTSLYAGTANSHRVVDGLRTQTVKMLVSSEQPYVRSGGTRIKVLDDILYNLKNSDPFSFMNEGILGVLNPVNRIQEAMLLDELENTPTQFAVSKKGTDLNGGKIHKGDKITYEIAASTTLPEIKNFDLGDRIPLSMNLLTGSVTCELQKKGETTWKVLSLKDECTLSSISGGELFQLYFKDLTLMQGDTLRISYQTEVVEDPIDFHLNLLSYKDAMSAIAATAGVDITTGLSAVGANIAMGDKAKRMGASVTSDTFEGKGSYYYSYKENNLLYEKKFIKNKTSKPGEGNPLIEQLIKLMGYEYDDGGNLIQKDPDKKPDENAIKDFAQNLGKTLQTVTSTDKDEDGVPDLWDNEIVEKPEYANKNLIGTQADLTFGGTSDATQQVNKRLSENNCYFGGCGLFPKNKALLVPGKSELFEGPDIPVFAFPTPSGVVPVWPPDASYFGSKSTSQIRVYFSVTLSARMAMAVCAGPYDFGTADFSFLSGILPVKPNANCYAFILPDVFDLVKLCQSLESALTGVVTAATDLIGGGTYAAARVKKRGIAGAGSEPDGAFIAYHYEFKDSVLSPSIAEEFMNLARNSSAPNTARNKHAGGFPKIPMDWVERQMQELLKLLKVPHIYIRLPDPRSLVGTLAKNAATMAKSVNTDAKGKERKALEEKLKTDKRAALEEKARKLGMVSESEISDGSLKSLVLSAEKSKVETEVASMDTAALNRKATELGIGGTGVLKEAALRNQVKDKMLSQTESRVGSINRTDLLANAKTHLLVLSDKISDEDLRSAIAAKQQQKIQENLEACTARIDAQAAKRIKTNNETVKNLEEKNKQNQNENSSTALNQNSSIIDHATNLWTTKDKVIQNIDDAVSLEAAKLSNAKDYLNTILDNAQGNINCEGDFFGQQMQNLLGDDSMYAEASKAINEFGDINSMLMKQQGIGDALEFLSKIPLLSITHEEVTFEYPWIAPEKFFEIKQNLQFVLDQSIENFQKFYKANADCFFDDPKSYNTISEPSFSIVPRAAARGTSGTPDVNIRGSTGADVSIRCLATARLGSDAWLNIQGLQKNLERLNEYANIQEKFKKYMQWKSYTIGQLVKTTTGVIDFLAGYITRQQKIINNWKRAISQIKNYSKAFQVVVDVFQNYRNACADCVNDKGSAMATMLDSLGNIIPDIPVIRVPKWPDIVVDFSNVRAQMRITIPDIKLRPVDFQIPKLTPITFPNISIDESISEQDLSLMIRNGIDVRFPVLPALPALPDLPEFPQLDLPKLADLPPPPIIPELDVTITTTIKILDKILQNICLVRKNLVPIPESELATQIEKLTRGTTLLKIKENKPSDIVLPGIDQVRISGYLKLVSPKPFTGLTDRVNYLARNWNRKVIGGMKEYIAGRMTVASEATSKFFSNAANSIMGADTKSTLDAFSAGIKSATASVNSGLSTAQGKIQKVGDDLAKTLSSAQKISATDNVNATSIALGVDQKQLEENAQLAHALSSPDVQDLFIQMDALKSLMENVPSTQGISFESYIPSLRAQVELLKTSGGHLGNAQTRAIEEIESIIALAERETNSLAVEDSMISADTYSGVRNWKAIRSNLETLHKDLKDAEYTINHISSAETLEEFKSVLADTGMLSSQNAPSLTADVNGGIITPEERNNTEQENLESIIRNAAVVLPIDYSTLIPNEALASQETLSDISSEVVKSGEMTSDITPITTSSSLIAATPSSPISNTTAATAKDISNNDGYDVNADTASNLFIQLNDLPGSFVPIMNYSGGNNQDSGLDSAEDLNGDGHKDIVYYAGRDIYVKYNILSKALGMNLGSGKAIYNGSRRIYTKSISSLMPVAARVQNVKIVAQNAQQATISFVPQKRGDTAPASPSVYAVRFHQTPDAWLTDSLVSRGAKQANYLEYYIYASPESTYGMDSSRQDLDLQQAIKVTDQLNKEELTQEKLGTPKERVIVVKKLTELQAIFSFTKSGIPYSTTIAPYYPETKSYGTFTTPVLLHPQREQDTIAPKISLAEGTYMTVPSGLKDSIEIKGQASDPSDIATLYWDKNTDVDSDQDGDATNDKDIVCSDPKNPAVAPCTVTSEKDDTYKVNAPIFKIAPFTEDQIGKKFYMRLHAVDTVGNIAVQDLTIEPRTTNIVIDRYDSAKGIVEGHIDPPRAGLELRVMRMRPEGNASKVISELPLPQTVMTEEGGTFRIEGILAKESLGILGSTNQQVAEVTKTGSIQVNETFKGKTLDVLVKQGSTYIRKLFSTLSIKSSSILQSSETTLGSSYLKNQSSIPTDKVSLQIFDKNKMRLQNTADIQKVEILNGTEWSSIYEFRKNTDNTLSMSEGTALKKSNIGGETVLKDEIYINMLLVNVDGVPAGLLTIPLGKSNEMFDVKGK